MCERFSEEKIKIINKTSDDQIYYYNSTLFSNFTYNSTKDWYEFLAGTNKVFKMMNTGDTWENE